MVIVKASEEEGVKIPAPYSRRIKVLLAPDKNGVEELSFNFALIDPGSQTDYHGHDRPELIYVVSGEGDCVTADGKFEIKADTILWVLAEEEHQVINTGDSTLKLATAFFPGYTAKYSYERCLDAAAEASEGG